MDTKTSSINLAMAEVLEMERNGIRIDGRKLSVEKLAEESGISYGTLRRILRGQLDVNIADLTAVVGVISKYRRTPITVSDVTAAAVERAGGMEAIVKEFGITPIAAAPVSEVPSTTDDLAERRRKQEEAARMSVEELEGVRGAATRDAELDSDEPDLP